MLTIAPDFEFRYTEDELKDIDDNLTSEEESLLQEILELEKQTEVPGDLMKDLLDAAKNGSLQYLDSIADTNDTVDHLKDPASVLKQDKIEIRKKNPGGKKDDTKIPRTMFEARTKVFDKNVTPTCKGMSETGQARFQKDIKAYAQRSKSISKVSKGGQTIHCKTDSSANFESLSGLRGYRVGPVVEMYPVDELKEMYQAAKKTRVLDNPSRWLFEKNLSRFKEQMMKDYGFKSGQEVKHWMSENHLTLHESPDGMFLVPTDVHDAASHSGYRSKMTELLQGKITKDKMYAYLRKEKIEYCKHEAKVRGTRALKGAGMAAIKEIMKCAIVVTVKEFYSEFKKQSEDKLYVRVLNALKKSWEHIKAKFESTLKNMWTSIKGSLLSELLTALNDFFFKTFKNFFKVVRQMWGSIKSAFKIVFSKDKSISWGERIFEASKILSAGAVAVLGFSLNELLEKGLISIGLPPFISSFIAECLSGLFAGVMSAIVIMLFDRFKKDLKAQSAIVRQMQLQSKVLCVNCARLSVSTLQMDMKVMNTYQFVGEELAKISYIRTDILNNEAIAGNLLRDMSYEVQEQQQRITNLIGLKNKYGNNEDF